MRTARVLRRCSAVSALGWLPLVLRLIVPFERCPGSLDRSCDGDRTQERLALASLSERDYSVVDALQVVDGHGCEIVRRRFFGDARLRRRDASGSCSEMHPMQRALHFGETGSAASPRSKKTFCAVKQA